MRFLLSNDDGIDSEYLRLLAAAAQRYGEVFIVAPDGQRSASSHCFTYYSPLRAEEYDYKMEGVRAYSCSGTPADCVRLGILSLMDERPDFVLAGINKGYNIGADIQYSGTVGAVLEASFQGVRGIALSMGSNGDPRLIEAYIDEALTYCMNQEHRKHQIYNVNFPECSPEECKGILTGRTLAIDDFYKDGYTLEVTDDGKHLYHIDMRRNWKGSEGTDLQAVIDNYVSIGTVNNIS